MKMAAQVIDLQKHYDLGPVVVKALRGVSLDFPEGDFVAILGSSGSGKSTLLNLLGGLDRPTSGTAIINGRPYLESAWPLAEIGALLDARAIDKGRSARNHLLALGATIGVGSARVDHLLELVGLAEVGSKSAGGFSLGMGQRLGIATALLGDPQTVMLDEPVNGLDPDGIKWIRTLLGELADEGRTVFVSSHLMSEMEMTAEHLIVVGRGRVLADMSMADFIAASAQNTVRVSSPDAVRLHNLLAGPGVTVSSNAPGHLEVSGMPAAQVGEIAALEGLVLHELVNVAPSLEEAFMKLTSDAVEYHGSTETNGMRAA
jgi:ABC-2 type transport system ATP-binding protein